MSRRTNPLKTDEAYRCYRVRMRPTAPQRQELQRWFAAARWAYNAMLAGIKDGRWPAHETACKNVTRDPTMPPWIKTAVHYTVYHNATLEAVRATKADLTKRRNNPNHRWNASFRSATRSRTETLLLDAVQFHANRPGVKDTGPVRQILPLPAPVAPRSARAHVFLGKSMADGGPVLVKDRNWLIDRLVADRWLRVQGRLQWDKDRRAFYLIVGMRRQRPADPEERDKRMVALDPGVRRFQQFYDPADGRHGVLLDGYHTVDHTGASTAHRPAADELERRCRRIDAAQARLQRRGWLNAACPQPPGRVGRRWAADRREGRITPSAYRTFLRRADHAAHRRAERLVRREWARLRGLKHGMHYAAIGFLWRHWDVVIVSTASFGDMCRSDRRPFGSRTARAALSWGHYAFRERLKSSAFGRAGKQVIETSEELTTQTCGLCGRRNPNVGRATVFRCVDAACGVHIDRDVNGARNIALKVFTQHLANGA